MQLVLGDPGLKHTDCIEQTHRWTLIISILLVSGDIFEYAHHGTPSTQYYQPSRGTSLRIIRLILVAAVVAEGFHSVIARIIKFGARLFGVYICMDILFRQDGVCGH